MSSVYDSSPFTDILDPFQYQDRPTVPVSNSVKRRAVTPAEVSFESSLPPTPDECVSPCKQNITKTTIFSRGRILPSNLVAGARGLSIALPQRVKQIHSLKVCNLQLERQTILTTTATGMLYVSPWRPANTVLLSIKEYGPFQSVQSDSSLVSPNVFICCRNETTDISYKAYPERKEMPPLTTMPSLERITINISEIEYDGINLSLQTIRSRRTTITTGGVQAEVVNTDTENEWIVTFVAEIEYEANLTGGVRC
jgi:hypothetical protein